MSKYIQPKMKVLALPEVMQNLYESSTEEPQLAKPNTDVDVEDFDEGWGLTDWGNDLDTWSDE